MKLYGFWRSLASYRVRVALAMKGLRAEEISIDLLKGRQNTDEYLAVNPQGVVPADWWQSAASLGDWTLVGCTVAPAFDFATFELAAPDWQPPKR